METLFSNKIKNGGYLPPFIYFLTLFKYFLPFDLSFRADIPQFHILIPSSTLFEGLYFLWYSVNISFDFVGFFLSLKVYLLGDFISLSILLHSFTNTLVICNIPTQLLFPFTAFGFPLLSTFMIALITSVQSNVSLLVFAFSDSETMVIKHTKKSCFKNFLITLSFYWDIDILMSNG